MTKELGHKLTEDGLVIPLSVMAAPAPQIELIDALLEREAHKIVIGVDPGASGALATINLITGAATVDDMPVTKQKINNHTRARVNPVAIAEWLQDKARYCVLACVEKGESRPADGPVQARNTGASWGLVVGVLAAKGIPVIDADPAKWKPVMKVTADKDTSRARACLLWPDMAHTLRLKKHDGRAEALLIAMYGILRVQRIKAREAGLLPS